MAKVPGPIRVDVSPGSCVNFWRRAFEVAVVRDETAGPRLATGDGYLAALTNYSFLAHAVWMTEEAASHIRRGGSATGQ